MLNVIDKYNGILIQKITDTKGNMIRYQTVPEAKVGNFEHVKMFDTLQAAREHTQTPVSQE